jgi:adenylate cyclase class IV
MEIEAKIQLKDNEEARSLSNRLAELAYDLSECKSAWFKERNLIFTKPGLEGYLRIRYETTSGGMYEDNISKIMLAYKGKNNSSELNKREEIQTEVKFENPEAFKQILFAIGYKLYSAYIKYREVSYLRNANRSLDAEVSVDWVAPSKEKLDWFKGDIFERNPEFFLEVEASSEKKVFAVLRKLDLQDRPIIKQSYAAIFRSKK